MTHRINFDKIYATDLLYARDCWKLCGDANCCNFSRYKSQLTMIGQNGMQELPMLPGEMDYLKSTGLDRKFGDFEHRTIDYPLNSGRIKADFIVSRNKSCACDHGTRTTVCRLYPLLPVYDIDGKMIGVDRHFGIFEEIEQIDGIERACKITQVPFEEMSKFLDIAAEIGKSPKAVFYVTAYSMAKAHARQQLAAGKKASGMSALALLERAFLSRRLLNQDVLRPQIEDLAAKFKKHHGERFVLD